MTAIWTPPITFTQALVTETQLNQQIRDNFEFLKTPPTALSNVNEASDATTTSTSFVDVDGAGTYFELSLPSTFAGGDLLVVANVSFEGTTGMLVYFNIAIDGVDDVANDGVIVMGIDATSNRRCATLVFLKQGLSVGAHTIKLRWKVNTGTATLWTGAGTAALDVHPQFWAREI